MTSHSLIIVRVYMPFNHAVATLQRRELLRSNSRSPATPGPETGHVHTLFGRHAPPQFYQKSIHAIVLPGDTGPRLSEVLRSSQLSKIMIYRPRTLRTAQLSVLKTTLDPGIPKLALAVSGVFPLQFPDVDPKTASTGNQVRSEG